MASKEAIQAKGKRLATLALNRKAVRLSSKETLHYVYQMTEQLSRLATLGDWPVLARCFEMTAKEARAQYEILCFEEENLSNRKPKK